MKTPIDFTPAFSRYTYDAIDNAHVWANYDAPRDECFMSLSKDTYTYGSGRGVRTYTPIPFSPVIDAIKWDLWMHIQVNYDLCFSNRYPDEKGHLGWHADDSPTIDQSVGIAVISFGAERELWFREMGGKDVEKLSLPHGSLCYMRPGMQSTHQHRIPKHHARCGPRISLTFRKSLKVSP